MDVLLHKNLPTHGLLRPRLCQNKISTQSILAGEQEGGSTLTMERKRYPDAAASSAALGEYISVFVIEVVKLNAAAKNPTNFRQLCRI